MGAGPRNQIILGDADPLSNKPAPGLTHGIIGPWAVVGHVQFDNSLGALDFATHDGNGTSVRAFSDYVTTDSATWDASSVARVSALDTLSADREVFALKLDADGELDLDQHTLNIVGGGLLYNSEANLTISSLAAGTLTSEAGELIVFTDDNNADATTLTISAILRDHASGPLTLVKAGTDVLALTGLNEYTGGTSVFGGTLSISDDANLGAMPVDFAAGHLKLYGSADGPTTLRLEATLDLNGNRGIEIGGGAVVIETARFEDGGVNVYHAVSYLNGQISGTQVTNLTLIGDTRFVMRDNTTIGGQLQISGHGVDTLFMMAGLENRIGGGLRVGINDANFAGGASSRLATLSYGDAGGTLVVGANRPGIENLDIGVRTANTGANVTTAGVVDLRGSHYFQAYVNNVRLGVITSTGNIAGATAEGILWLPTHSEIYAATSVIVGQTAAGNGVDNSLAGVVSQIHFGSGTSVITTPLFVVGDSRSTGEVNLHANGTLTIQGITAHSTDLVVGRRNVNLGNNNAHASTGTFDAMGTLVADLNQLIIGQRTSVDEQAPNANANVTGSMTTSSLAGNHIVTNSLQIGSREGIGGGAISVFGTLHFGGGVFQVLGDALVGFRDGAGAGSATGTWNITGGEATVFGTLTISDRHGSGAGTATGNVSVTDGTFRFGGLQRGAGAGTASFTAGSGGGNAVLGGLFDSDSVNHNMTVTLAGNLTFNTPTGRTTTFLAGAGFGGTGDLTKTGTGRLVLEGANTHNGVTHVNEGTLVMNGSITSDIQVNSGGRLAGNGEFLSHVTINSGGTFAPGNSVGEPPVDNLTWNGGGRLEWDVAGLPGIGAEGTDWDLVNVLGTLTINATDADNDRFVIRIVPLSDPQSNIPGFIPGFDTLEIVETEDLYVGTAGWLFAQAITVDPLTINGPDPRFTFDASALRNLKGVYETIDDQSFTVYVSDNNFYINYSYQAVPEPGSMLLVGLGALGIAGYGWRRRKAMGLKGEAPCASEAQG